MLVSDPHSRQTQIKWVWVSSFLTAHQHREGHFSATDKESCFRSYTSWSNVPTCCTAPSVSHYVGVLTMSQSIRGIVLPIRLPLIGVKLCLRAEVTKLYLRILRIVKKSLHPTFVEEWDKAYILSIHTTEQNYKNQHNPGIREQVTKSNRDLLSCTRSHHVSALSCLDPVQAPCASNTSSTLYHSSFSTWKCSIK